MRTIKFQTLFSFNTGWVGFIWTLFNNVSPSPSVSQLIYPQHWPDNITWASFESYLENFSWKVTLGLLWASHEGTSFARTRFWIGQGMCLLWNFARLFQIKALYLGFSLPFAREIRTMKGSVFVFWRAMKENYENACFFLKISSRRISPCVVYRWKFRGKIHQRKPKFLYVLSNVDFIGGIQ